MKRFIRYALLFVGGSICVWIPVIAGVGNWQGMILPSAWANLGILVLLGFHAFVTRNRQK